MDRRLTAALRLMAALGAVSAPALFAQLALVQAGHAQALPPPPYAADGGRQPVYGGQQGYDRYGGGGAHRRVAASGAPVAYNGPRLAWSGKTDGQPAAPAAIPAGPATMGPPQPAAYARPYVTMTATAPAARTQAAPRGWSYVPTAAPTSIYAPPPPAAPAAPVQPQQQASNDAGARHYSLHRAYGLAPDPIPIPPQFFGPTADLTQPETAEPLRRTVTADGKSHNALQPEGGQ